MLALLILGFIVCAVLTLNPGMSFTAKQRWDINFTVVDKFTTESMLPGASLSYDTSKYGYYLRLASDKYKLRILVNDVELYRQTYLGSSVKVSCLADPEIGVSVSDFENVACSLVEYF